MLINKKGQIWDEEQFSKESELEGVLYEHYRLLYGDESLIFTKSQIKTAEGTKTIPDAFVINVEDREWFIVEAELLHHGVYEHIVKQVTKQIIAATNPETKALLKHEFVDFILENKEYLRLFHDLEIPDTHIERVVGEILDKDPIISIPIDAVNRDLEAWAKSLRFTVVPSIIHKFKNRETGELFFEFPDPEQAAMDHGTGIDWNEEVYQLNGRDLMLRMLKEKLVRPGQKLLLKHKGKTFKAAVEPNGELRLESGETHASSSLAAIACIQTITPDRKTANGLASWRTEEGKTLRELRLKLFGEPKEIEKAS